MGNTDASKTADDIRKWREKEEDKIGTEIALAQAEHDSDVLRITTLYNNKHAEIEKVLQDEMQKRVAIEEAIHDLSMKTPEDTRENKRIYKKLTELNKKRQEIVHRIDQLNDELTELTLDFRKNKMSMHEKLE